MRARVESDSEAYRRAVDSQLAQFPDAASMHDLPPIFHYWSEKFLAPRASVVLGGPIHFQSFAARIIKAVDATGINRVLSIGAGDAAQEIELMCQIKTRGRDDIFILATDLLPNLVEHANAKIKASGLEQNLSAAQCDVNVAFPPDPVAAVIVIDALHHMIELETLFDNILSVIGENGVFLARDMIGRNGHQRWPEVLEPLRALWQMLPMRLKRHSRIGRTDRWFENFDCSTEGFEGVRAQDILPLLVSRFSFEAFLGYGSLVEVFIERNFGPNFNVRHELDRLFIDRLQELEDHLLLEGAIRPTSMCAVMRRKNPAIHTDTWNGVSPSNAVRDPQAIVPPASFDSFENPYLAETPFSLPCQLRLNEPAKFEKGQQSLYGLRWGWHEPEPHVWSYGEDSAIVLSVLGTRETASEFVLNFGTYGYVVPNMGQQELAIIVDGRHVATAVHTFEAPYAETAVRIARPAAPSFLVRFRPSYVRNADRDGGPDKRAIAFMLVKIWASAY